MKRPTGRIQYEEDRSISYSASGRNPPRSWQVIVDGVGRVNSDKTYAWAAIHLASELSWRDPEVQRLRQKAKDRETELYQAHLARLTESRPDQDSTDPQLGRISIYPSDGGDTCHVCFTHNDHASVEIAHQHGCTR